MTIFIYESVCVVSMKHEFVKKAVQVGSSKGFVIPHYIVEMEAIRKGDVVKVTVEKIRSTSPDSVVLEILPRHEAFDAGMLLAEAV